MSIISHYHLITINTSTSREDYDCGEIERYKNDYLEKFTECNQGQSEQQQEPE